jgi:hypothetical protein
MRVGQDPELRFSRLGRLVMAVVLLFRVAEDFVTRIGANMQYVIMITLVALLLVSQLFPDNPAKHKD